MARCPACGVDFLISASYHICHYCGADLSSIKIEDLEITLEDIRSHILAEETLLGAQSMGKISQVTSKAIEKLWKEVQKAKQNQLQKPEEGT